MAKRIFKVEFEGSCEIEIDDEVINVVDDDWRDALYDLDTPEDIAEHIATNLVINKWKLSQLDGWADMEDELAKILWDDIYAIYAEELYTE